MLKLLQITLLFLSGYTTLAQALYWNEVFYSRNAEGVAHCNEMIYSLRGGFYITGYFEDELVFPDTSLNGIGGRDAFIAYLDDDFNLVWIRAIGGPGNESIHGLAEYRNGSIIVTGYFEDSILIGGTKYKSLGEQDVFILCFSQEGDLIWNKVISGPGNEAPGNNMAIDSLDNIYLIGRYGGNGHSPPLKYSAWFDKTMITSLGGDDIFLAKYDNLGNLKWVQSAGGPYFELGLSVSVKEDKLFITGAFQGPWIDFNGYRLPVKRSSFSDMFIAMYDTAGNFYWARGAGNKNPAAGIELTVDSYKRSYVTGSYFSDDLSFGNFVYLLPSLGDFDMFIASYDSNGTFRWARNAGGGSTDLAGALAMDTAGFLYTGGIYSHFTVLDQDTLKGLWRDPFVAKLSPDGDYLWSIAAEGGGVEFVDDIIVLSEEEVYLLGSFQSSKLRFGPISIENTGEENFFIARLGADSIVTGIKSTNGLTSPVTIYPNPTDGREVTLTFRAGRYECVQLYDLHGRLLRSISITSDEDHIVIDMSRYGRGAYLLHLQGRGFSTSSVLIH